MIKLTDKDKTLVVPSGLGNLGQKSGSGGGVTPEEAASIASAVTAEALDEYDTELQVDLEDIRDAVSANTQDIAILSGLSTEIAAISGQTTANTQNIGILSGDVETNTLAIANLENVYLPDLSQAIAAAGQLADSANTKVETLSASTVALSQTVAGKQDTLTAGNGIDLSGSTISVKIGEGLGFSGDTLVVSGGSGEQNYVIVNQLGDITNPVKGMLAYVKYTVINKAWVIDASQISENFVAYIYYDGENYARVYRSGGGDFHWDWNNNASDWTYGNNIWYKIDKDNGLFYAACDNQAAYITLENGSTSAETTAQLTVDSPYLYNGTAWEKKSLVTDYFLETMTSAERLSLYNMLADIMGGSNDGGGLTKIFSNYRFFTAAGQIDGQNTSQVFFSNFENEGVYFCGTKTSKQSYEPEVYRVVAYINGNDGSLQTNVNTTKQNPEGTYVKFTSGGTMVEGDAYNFARACGNNSPNGYYALQYNGIFIVDENNYDTVLCYTNLDCSVPLSTSDYPDMGFGFRAVFNFYLGGNFYRVIGDIVQGGSDEGWHLISCTQI